MGSMVCLCGKRYKDPINVYTQEKDPFWICLAKCQDRTQDRPSHEDVHAHNNNHDYKVGGMVWGKQKKSDPLPYAKLYIGAGLWYNRGKAMKIVKQYYTFPLTP